MRRNVLALALLALPLCALAADVPKPDFYLVHEEIVRPAMVASYESTNKELFTLLSEKNVTNPSIAFNTYATPDLRYVFVTRLTGGLSGLEGMYAAWATIGESLGKKYQDIEARGSATVSSYSDMLILRRPDLSYQPANPRLKMEEHLYNRLQYYYLVPGKEREAEAIAKEYTALFKSKNIGDGYTIFTAVIGQDLPLLIASIGAKSAADFIAADERTNAALGNDLKTLQARALAITRRFETRDFWYRPDLSYPPPRAAAK